MYMGNVNTHAWKPRALPFSGVSTHAWQPRALPFGEVGLGPLVIPAVSAVSSLIGPLTSLISGKKHYSPWGFLIDDYPDNIVANETKINQLQQQLAMLIGQAPPPQFAPASGFQGHKGSPAWQATMMPLIQKYAPGYVQYVKGYDRQLVDGYQQAYQAQQNIMNTLGQQITQAQQQRGIIEGTAIPGSPTALPPLSQPYPNYYTPPGTQTPMLMAPQGVPGAYYQSPISPYPQMTQPTYLPPISSPMPSNITVSTPGSQPQVIQAGFENWPMLLVAGGAALMIILATSKQSPARTRVVYRSAKKRRR